MDGQTGSWFGLVAKRVMSLANSVERFFPILFDFARSLRGQSPPRMIPERPITGLVRLAGGSEPIVMLAAGTIMISVPAGQTKHPMAWHSHTLLHKRIIETQALFRSY